MNQKKRIKPVKKTAKKPAKKIMVPLKDLNLTNRFLFDQVMEDPLAQQAALSIIFDREVPLLSKTETEKELRVSPNIRAIRMDVYTMDEEKVIYNTEMQSKQKADLLKRSRCVEVPGLVLGDGTARIFLNIKGENPEEVSEELVEFLHYLEETTDARAVRTNSPRIKYIHDRVCKVKTSEEVGVKYMQAWEERYYELQDARAEGLEEGRAEGLAEGDRVRLVLQIQKKLAKGKSVKVIADEVEESVELVEQLIAEKE